MCVRVGGVHWGNPGEGNDGLPGSLRRLMGPVTPTPQTPEVGRPYFTVDCRVDSLNLLHVAEESSNLLHWWTRLQPIRTVAELDVEFVVFTHEPFQFQ